MKKDSEIKSSAHSKYRCQYHIVFAPKYRRKAIYGEIKRDIGEILRKLCVQKGVEIIEAEACADHIHIVSVWRRIAWRGWVRNIVGICAPSLV